MNGLEALEVKTGSIGEVPLSHGQRALWFLDLLAPGNAAYVVAGAVRVRAGLDPEALRRCLRALTARHAALRTVFREEDGGPVALVRAALEPDFTVVPAAESAGWDGEELAHRLTDFAYRGFDLEHGPLVRLGLFEQPEGPLMVLALHHIVSDFWSLGLLVRELGALYSQETGGAPADLAPLDLTYGDWVRAQEERLAGPEGERLWAWWREALQGVPQVLELPADRPRPARQGFRGGTVELRLDPAQARLLARLGRQRGATLAMTLLAGFGALLGRWTGQERLLIGMPTTGRRSRELAGLVGYLVNPVAVGIDLRDDASFGELVERVRDAARGAFDHQDFPLPLLAERLQPERDPSRPPLFQVAALLQKGRRSGEDGVAALWAGAAGAAVPFGALELESITLPDPGAQFDVTLALAEWRGELVGRLQYDRDLFDRATVRRLAVQLERLLAAAAASPGTAVSELPLLGPAERQQVLIEWSYSDTDGTAWNFSDTDSAGGATALAQFEVWARRMPEILGVAEGERVWSYGELDARAGRLAARLRGLGARPGNVIGICLERSPELVAAVLAIGKCGAAYLPLDPAHPRERLAWQLQDAGARLLVTDEHRAGLAESEAGEVQAVVVSEEDTDIAGEAEATMPGDSRAAGQDALAYVIYTSGSTGRPKGTLLGQRGLSELVAWQRRRFGLTPTARTTLVAGVGFDASVWEMWLALTGGASLWIPPASVIAAPAVLGPWLTERAITHCFLSTPLAEALIDEGLPEAHHLQVLFTGGDRLHRTAPEDGRFQLVNLYGPTECTSVTTSWEAPAGSAEPPPIGRPIARLRTLLLDRTWAPVPPGVAGELYVGGTGLAWGYLGRPELTAERFLPDAFLSNNEPGGRLYRTGDLARFLADGVLEFLGRIDQQVKVRGHRIELGEVEAALAGHPALRETAVLVRGQGGETRLIACVVPRPGEAVVPADLRAWLAERLPAASVPSGWVALDALPLTPNGKVDRRALAGLAEGAESGGGTEWEAPSTPTEETLAAIWRDLLGVPRVGREDDFFHLGGHSLLAARLASRVREAFGVEMGPARAFEAPTLAALAHEVDKARGDLGSAAPPLVTADRSRPLPLSFAQERLWFLEQLEPGSAVYNVPGGLRLRGSLDVGAVASALRGIVARHEALRTSFRVGSEAGPVQVAAAAVELAVPVVDLSGLSGVERREAVLQALAQDEAVRPFDLGRAPLLRTTVVRLGPVDHCLLVTLHHLVSDGWSLGLLVRELAAGYGLGAPDPGPLPVQYADFAVWQRSWLEGSGELERQVELWRGRLAELPEALELPADLPRPAVQSSRGGHLPVRLGRALAEGVRELARRSEATPFMVLLAAFAALLSRLTGQLDLAVGAPVAGRTRGETEELIGLFVNTLVLRCGLAGDPTVSELVGRTRRTVLEATAHQELPFEKLVEALAPERDRSRPPLVQVVLAYQESPLEGLTLGDLEIETLEVESGTAKFDLALVLEDRGGELAGYLEYSSDLFYRATAKRFLEQLERLLAAAVAEPGLRLSELPLLGIGERQQVVREWNDTTAVVGNGSGGGSGWVGKASGWERGSVGAEISALAQFEAWVERTPEAPAVMAGLAGLGANLDPAGLAGLGVDLDPAGPADLGANLDVGAELVSARAGGGVVWSYADLDARAERLADRLRGLGAGPGDVVAICLERSPELVAAVLGIGKTGAAYLPLDPAHPSERLAWQLQDAAVRLLVTDERHFGLAGAASALRAETSSAPTPGEVRVVLVSEIETDSALVGVRQRRSSSDLDALAYVIYTSGSTGRPKGTLLGQRGLANLVAWHRRTYSLTPEARTTLVAGVGFDASVWEMWPTLAAGASLWIPPAGTVADPTALGAWIAEHGITHSFLPTPLAEAVLDEGLPEPHALRFLLTGGDRLHRSAPEGSRFRLFNHYGPTESTVVTTSWEVPAGSPGAPPIGRPIAGIQALLLDSSFAPVPPGAAGELYVGGTGLAWGYLGRADLTAERFLPDAFATPDSGLGACLSDRNGGLGARLYRTGDVARCRPDGILEFLSRADQQVKVRGHRIELGEIEAALVAHPAVREAAVLVEGTGRNARLNAYLVARPGEEASPEALRAWLVGRLPVALIPTGWTVLETLPLNASGKVDRQALARLSVERVDGRAGDREAPATPTEETLAAIWSDLLGIEHIGRGDNFFHLGGHSLLVARHTTRIREVFGVELSVARTFEVPTLAAQAAEIEQALGARRRSGPLVPIARHSADGSAAELPASFAQERLWFLDQLAPGNPAYNIAGGVRLTGDLNVGVLASVLARIVERHEALRTTFGTVAGEGRPVQVIGPARVALPVIDLSGLRGEVRAGEAERLACAEAARPFDLACGPLLRCVLLRMAEEHRLLITLHHIVGDGWSVAVLVRELGELYRAGTVGEPARLPDLPVQYADFAAWQREWLAGDELVRQTAYWRDRLAGAPAALDLPADRPRPPVQSHNGAHVPIVLPADLRNRLAALARRREATPFMVLLAAWNALLLRTTGQDDLVVGTPVAGRTRRETEDLIGFFVNTLPLRADLSGDPDFGAALARIRQGVLAAFAHQDLPFEKLVEALAPERDRSRSPIFQVMLAFQGSPFAALDLPGLRAEPFASPLPVAKFDLTLTLEESGGLLAGGLEYCSDLFDRATAERLAGRLRVLLEAVASHPDRRLSELPDLTLAERQQLLEWNAAATAYPDSDLLLHELIGRQAGRTPEAPALAFAGETLSYRDLWALAGRLAARLRDLGAGPEIRVGICAERSPEMVIGLLAVLRAGAAYVPLDPSYPADRLAYMLADSEVPLLLAQPRFAEILPANGSRVVWLEESGGEERDLPELSLYPDAFDFQPLESPGPDGLAYVIYTSGSTGQPKGAMNTHRAIVNRLLWMQAEYGLTAADRVLQKTPFSFDVSVWEFFWPLLTGACLVVARPGEHREPEALIRTIEAHVITTLHFVPSMLQLFLETPGVERCTSLRRVIASGEALPYDLQQRFFTKLGHTGAGLHNLYGPTEAAVDVTYWPCDPAGRAGIVPIGRPVANTTIHLLDRNLVPLPLGAAGELYIGGVQLARGYLGKAGLTAERFVPDPFSVPDSFQVERQDFGVRQSDRNGGLGARLYRTGDLARRLPSGEIEYLGRLDHQVKVRGFRIELGEIETALLAHPGVREAVVVARESRLVAYLVAPSYLERPDEAATDFANVLARRLPEHMVPSAFVLLPALPLSPNGKVDRRALPAPDLAGERSASRPPGTPTEEGVARIWAEVLGLPVTAIGADDHFFRLGGHSLLAARVVARIRTTFGIDLPLARLFAAPTVAGLAAEVDRLLPLEAGPELAPIPRLARPAGDESFEVPASFAQERLWFLDQLEPGSVAYHMLGDVRLSGTLAVDLLERAFAEIVRRHETLRTTFAAEAGSPLQVIAPPGGRFVPALPLVDLAGLPEEPRAAEAARLRAAAGRLPFDLAAGPLLRLLLLRTGRSEHELLLALHHIVADGWSMGVLIRELAALYDALAGGRPPSLAELPVQYADYAVWQRGWLAGERLAAQLAYWRERLAGAPAALELPCDRPRPALRSPRGGTVPIDLPPDFAAGIARLAARQDATLFMVLLAAFQALLGRLTGTRDLVVGSPVANRDRLETEGLIGFFVNTLVLRGDLAGDPAFGELVARARDTVLGASAHQDLPFERLVEEIGAERDRSRTPLFQVMLAYQVEDWRVATLPGLTLTPLALDNDTAKFDLTLTLGSWEGRLAGDLSYNRDLFDAATAERLAGYFQVLLAGVVADPDRRLSELELLRPAERRQLLAAALGEPVASGADLVLDRIAAQAARAPEAPAIVWAADERASHGMLSYGDLWRRSGLLASLLGRLGVMPEQVVGVLLPRSDNLVVALLAVLRAGGVYLPLDPALPAERLEYLTADSGAVVVLTVEALRQRVPAGAARVVCLDALPDEGGVADLPPVLPGQLAYVIYTSGSTGLPKGVAVEHAAAAAHLQGVARAYGLTPADRVLLFAGLGFDVAIEQLLTPLAAGAAVVLRDEDLWVPAELLDHLAGLGVTVANLPTAYWVQWLADLRARPAGCRLRLVIAGGEAMPLAAPGAWRGSPLAAVRLLNAYGPTEAVITATLCDAGEGPPAGAGGAVPLGSPLAGRRAHVLGPDLSLVPGGGRGELCLGGILARGYLGRPDLTAERFLPDPFAEVPGERLYRTGDLARRMGRTGELLEFLGRADGQVKVRGFRIELGEVEAALVRHPEVTAAAVIAAGEGDGRRLAAWVVVREEPAGPGLATELRAFLRAALPESMIPADVRILAALPLTANGKVDRRALARLAAAEPAVSMDLEESAVPRTTTEEVLAGLWEQVLPAGSRFGRDHSFFEAGGHSLLATRLIARVQEAFDLSLPVAAVFAAPTLAGMAAEIERRRGAGADLTPRPAAPPIVPAPRDRTLLLSFAQERLWFLDQLEPGNPVYNMPGAFLLTGRLTGPAGSELALAPVLGAALCDVVRRHEVLRTTFVPVRARPVQAISPDAAVALPEIDLRALADGARAAEAERLGRAEARRPFDLAAGPLLRTALLRLNGGDGRAGGEPVHLLLITLHHSVADGWSVGILTRELAALATTVAAGRPSPLPPLAVQYADFAVWQREWLAGGALAHQLGYWQERLAGAAAVLDLPADRPRPALQSFRGSRLPVALPADLAAGLAALARRGGATLFMTLLAGFQALLGRLAGRDDVCVGSPIAGRNRLQTEGLIGFFVNSLVLRLDLAGRPSFTQLLARARQATLEAYDHQDLPFDKLVEALRPERDLGHAPLFQVLFAFQNTPQEPLRLPGLALAPVTVEAGSAKFDLSLGLERTAAGLAGGLEYSRDLFDATTVARWAGQLAALLAAAVADPARPWGELPLLPAGERQQLLIEWSGRGARAAAVPPTTLPALFAEQAARRPAAPALLWEGGSLSYGELDAQAGRVARRLRALGIGAEAVVGVCLERSPRMVAGLLGILRAGGAYLPLDLSLPVERLRHMIADAGVGCLLAERGLAAGGSAGFAGLRESLQLVLIEDCLDAEPPAQPSVRLPSEICPEQAAYVIYTSGSTGRPKGVVIPHGALGHRLRYVRDAGEVREDDRFLHKTTLSFDASIGELFGPLAAGGAVVLAPPGAERDVPALIRLTRELAVTQVSFTASTLSVLLQDSALAGCERLRTVLTGAETVPADLPERFHGRLAADLFNRYGPTETTISVISGRCSREQSERTVPIGRPIADSEVLLLDPDLQPVPIGVAGELYIGGPCVGRGYLGRPELTAAAFVPHLDGGPGARLYRTGDLARFRPDGALEFVGRVDQQVKIRGFRVELGEIEALLVQHPAVRDVAVAVRGQGTAQRLVAFVAPRTGESVTAAELLVHIEWQIPGYMVPDGFVFLEALPLLPTGKVDRRALLRIDESSEQGAGRERAPYEPPSTPVEELLAELWSEVLGIEHIGIHDDFFVLGGHSLLVTQVLLRIKDDLGVELPVRSFFEDPTIAGVALALAEQLTLGVDENEMAALLAGLE